MKVDDIGSRGGNAVVEVFRGGEVLSDDRLSLLSEVESFPAVLILVVVRRKVQSKGESLAR